MSTVVLKFGYTGKYIVIFYPKLQHAIGCSFRGVSQMSDLGVYILYPKRDSVPNISGFCCSIILIRNSLQALTLAVSRIST